MALKFEWDKDKAERNIKKHGVRFETAAKVFLDDDRIEIYDEAHSIGEDRYIVIGFRRRSFICCVHGKTFQY